MGARGWHAAKARRNYEAARHFRTDYIEWSVTALFYSALHHVHSSLADEDSLRKDERHPRKHTSAGRSGDGGRGVNQLVRDLYPQIEIPYRSLFEASYRTRYDLLKFDEPFDRFEQQWRSIKRFCEGLNQGRDEIPTARP